jgi:hypothetical protein
MEVIAAPFRDAHHATGLSQYIPPVGRMRMTTMGHSYCPSMALPAPVEISASTVPLSPRADKLICRL